MSELPQSRIKKIIKLDPDYSGISASAVQLITKATELFMQDVTSKASVETRRQQRKKITYEDFYSVIKSNQSLYFLSDVVPKKYRLRELIDSNNVQLKEDIEEGTVKSKDEVVHQNSSAVKRQGILAFTNNNKTETKPPAQSLSKVLDGPTEEPQTEPLQPTQPEPQQQPTEPITIDISDKEDEDDDDDEMIDS